MSALAASLRKFFATPLSHVNEEAIDEFLKEVSTILLQGDVNVKQVFTLRNSVKHSVKLDLLSDGKVSNQKLKKKIQETLFKELVKLLTPTSSGASKRLALVKGRSNVVMFVGLQGAGKTTTCTKYAQWWKRRGKTAALVCADTFRAGAFDQLKQNAAKVKVPFYGSCSNTDPCEVAYEGVSMFKRERIDLIIVDTSGRHKQHEVLFEEMRLVEKAVQPDEIIFVMDSHLGQACAPQAEAFKNAVQVASVIVTKLDGHAKGGGAVAAVAATQCPISFVGKGEAFDDFEEFDAESFVCQLLELTDARGFLRRLKDAMPVAAQQPKSQKKLLTRIATGGWTFTDMKDQFQMILKMGSLTGMVGMIPGLSKMLPAGFGGGESTKILQQFCYMIDSMTPDERELRVPIPEWRFEKIARGSGAESVSAVKLLVQQHKMMSSFFGKMLGGKQGLAMARRASGGGGGMAGGLPNMANLSDMMNKLMGGGQ